METTQNLGSRYHRDVTISKALAIVVALSTSSVAGPADTVTQFLKHNSFPKDLAPLLRKDAIVVVDDTISRNATGDDAASYMMWFVTKSVGTVTVQTSGNVTWFSTSVEADSFDQSGDACYYQKQCSPIALHFHASGALIDGKIAVVILTRTMPDRELLGMEPGDPAPAKIATTGDKDLATAASMWLGGKLSANAAPHATTAGTAPTEIATEAATGKLAAKWDKLALKGVSLEATVLPEGVGFVYADVRWPYMPKQPVQLRLAALALRDHGAWKWIVLDFAR